MVWYSVTTPAPQTMDFRRERAHFWLADNYVLQGRRIEAEKLFERLLTLRNDVGLLAEEYDPESGRQLGNFPQAFTHLALVGAAIAIGEGQSMRSGGARAT